MDHQRAAAATYSVSASTTEGDADTTVTLAEGAAIDDVELVLVPRVDVTGTVVDLETGAPVPGASVYISRLRGPSRVESSDAGERGHVRDGGG